MLEWFAFKRGVFCETNLVHGRLNFSGSKQYLEILFVKVADTDAPKRFLNFRATWKTGSTGKVHLARPASLIFSIVAQAVGISGTARPAQ